MTNLTYFNWKKFINHDCKLISTWLEECGNKEKPLQIILKMIALILKDNQEPSAIIAIAASDVSLDAVLSIDFTADQLDIPDYILQLVGYWQHTIPKDAAFLGNSYEKLATSRRSQGNYYTPAEAIQFIIKNTVEECNILTNPWVKILDPSCGCGYFLLHAYEVLYHKFTQSRAALSSLFPALDLTDQGIHDHIIKHNLWGADIDATAIAITALSLSLKNSCKNRFQANLVVYDSLKRPEDQLLTEKTHRFWSNTYDYVLGNPPYLSFGLRGTGSLEPQYRDYLRQAYLDSAEYKMSYYVLFIQRGIELLKEGGKLGYIIPDSFLLGRYYSKIRRYILEHTAINSITHISSGVFNGASIGYSVICILQKCADPVVRSNHLMQIYQPETIDSLDSTLPVCEYEQGYFSVQPFQRFRIFFDLKLRSLVEKIEAASTTLKQYASGHTGIRSLTKQNEIISLQRCGDTWHRGLISGRQINRYDIAYQGHWLNIHPELLYKGGWKESIVKQRKILIRQTGDTIIAGIDNDGHYHLNNIHSFVLKETEITLDYLLMILNSRLMSFYYHITSMEYGRPMAQTDIETLELLPIVVNDPINSQAAELVAAISECARKAALDGSDAYKRKFQSVDEYLNQIVYRIYHLSDEEINSIEHYEKIISKRFQRRIRS